MIVPDPPGPLPFAPLREHLYTQGELTARTSSGPRLEQVIGDWFHAGGHGVDFAVARRCTMHRSTSPWPIICWAVRSWA